MRHNDPLFDLVQETFQDFTPEVPATAYAGIQAKMKKKRGFWNFAYNSLNVYYVGAAIGAGLLAMTMVNTNTVATAEQFESLKTPFVTIEKTQRVISANEKLTETDAETFEHISSDAPVATYTALASTGHKQLEPSAVVPCGTDEGQSTATHTELKEIEPTAQLPAKILPVTIQGFGLLKAKSILDQVALPGDEIVLTIPVHVEVEEE